VQVGHLAPQVRLHLHSIAEGPDVSIKSAANKLGKMSKARQRIAADQLHASLEDSPVTSKIDPEAPPVLEAPDGGAPGPRLLEPSTFDEAAYHLPVPLVTASALRAYIERQARPLEKVIRIANGQEVNGHNPSWDDQKAAIYKLVDKVAPDLRAVEVTHDVQDGADTGTEQTVNKLVDALTRLALAKRSEEAAVLTIENDGGQG
jgi:hypothetical protein